MTTSYLRIALVIAALTATLAARPLLAAPPVTKLQALIKLDPSEKLQSGADVSVAITVKNVGSAASAPGKIQIRFVTPGGIKGDQVKFETEVKDLPSIAAGESVELAFTKKHNMPSIIDFIREDWLFRGYEAHATIGGADHVIGTRSLSVISSFDSAPYTAKETPAEVPSAPPTLQPTSTVAPARTVPRIFIPR